MSDDHATLKLAAAIDKLADAVVQHALSQKVASTPQAAPGAAPRGGGSSDRPKAERTKYDWSQGGDLPKPDNRANLCTEGQVRRLNAIAKASKLDLDASIKFLFGPRMDETSLNWKEGNYLANAMEDGWRPSKPETRAPVDDYQPEPF